MNVVGIYALLTPENKKDLWLETVGGKICFECKNLKRMVTEFMLFVISGMMSSLNVRNHVRLRSVYGCMEEVHD